MNKNKFLIYCLQVLLGAGAMGLVSTSFVSCKEDVNSSNFSISSKQSMADFLATTDSLSDIKSILERVKLGSAEGASSIYSVVSARGVYTLFAPSNKAVRAYTKALIGTEDVSKLSDDQASLIAESCIIDNTGGAAYQSTSFPLNGTFDQATLNGRILACEERADLESSGATTYFVINGNARVSVIDKEVSNGYVHVVDAVIAPSSSRVTELLEQADNMAISQKLYEQTGLSALLVNERDSVYEREPHTTTHVNLSNYDQTQFTQASVQHRLKGYTIFVETDEVLQNWIGATIKRDDAGNITNWDSEVLPALTVKCKEAYPEATATDLKDPNNAVNKFLTYHVIEGRLAAGSFVRHYTEYNYQAGSDKQNPQQANFPVDVWDYYTTIDRRLVKISQASGGESDEKPYYINRITDHNYYINGTGKETTVIKRGAVISPTNGEKVNNAINGFYYPIDGVLLYDQSMRDALGSERMRFDLSTMLPEFYSNGLRSPRTPYTVFDGNYFDNITLNSSSTDILFLSDATSKTGGGWNDYQGDEFIFMGAYDFVLKLPPVPKDGQYEIRMGTSNNSLRGMAQIYFGDDKTNLNPIGLPLDMRLGGTDVSIGWVADVENDSATNAANDRSMRNQGYMKAPKYMTSPNTKNTFRAASGVLRRIITQAYMEADKTYYLRFKSALRTTSAQFFVDYFEIVPRSVYNGVTSEDIW